METLQLYKWYELSKEEKRSFIFWCMGQDVPAEKMCELIDDYFIEKNEIVKPV